MFKLDSFIPLLKFWLMPLVGSFFAAGADVLGSVGEAEGAVVESADAGDGGEAAAGSEGGEGSEGAEEEGAAAAKPAAAATKPGLEMAKPLSAGAKNFLNDLKETNHEAWKDISTRLWGKNTIDKQIAEHFPERGLEEAVELKSTVESLLANANAQSLAQIEEELRDVREVDTKLINGDPTFINSMPPEARAGIFKMMPHFLNEWGAENPEAYEHWHAGIFTATIRESPVALALRDSIREAERMGLDDQSVKFVHDSLKVMEKFFADVKAKGDAAPKAKTEEGAKDPDLVAREQSVAQKERGFARQRVSTEASKPLNPIATRILNELVGKRKDVNRGEVVVRMRGELARTLGKSFHDRIEQFLDAGDEAGAVKYWRSQVTEGKLREAYTKAFKYLYGEPTLGSPKPKPKEGEGGGAPAAATGFAKIKYNPKPSSIDLAASDKLAKELGLPNRNRLFAQNKAVLKGGKKVTWDQEAEPEA